MNVDEWAKRYAQAWEDADADAAAALFSEAATYQSQPFQEPHQGREGVREYWREVTSRQANVEVSIGRTMSVGTRAVVEWWTQMESDGTPVTLPGALLLDFDADGLCSALREYWNVEVGRRVPPPAGWGA
jgi:hypothetical protein